MFRPTVWASLACLLALGLGDRCGPNDTATEVLAAGSLAGKVAIVTGGDGGIGYEVALALASRGAAVVIGNRNETSGRLAASGIAAATGSATDWLPLDLSSFESVRAFASGFAQRHGLALHFLVNNAGVAGPSFKTPDGFEFVFETDYLGHFLLTELLLGALRHSAPSRVINVASGAHDSACVRAGWPADCFKDWTYLPPPVVPSQGVPTHSSYGIAKFANIQHAAELARREASHGIQAYSVTPGFALTSMTQKFDPESPEVKAICAAQTHPDPSLPANPCPFSAAQGAAIVAEMVASQGLQSGGYYSRTWACQRRPVAMQGFTDEMSAEFYRKSLEWTRPGAVELQV